MRLASSPAARWTSSVNTHSIKYSRKSTFFYKPFSTHFSTHLKAISWLGGLLPYLFLANYSCALRPVFNYPNNIVEEKVDENSKIGSVVAHIQAFSETDSNVNYSMQAWRASVEEQHNPVFVMDKSGVVTVAAEIDLEDPKGKTKTQYKFKVTASNTKTNEASFCWLLIHVNDVNDNEPVFGQSEYKFSVHESTPTRTIVGSVDVTDKDLMDQGNLRLSLVEKKSRKSPTAFTIDKYGRIMTHEKLDREKIAFYKFYVIAKDSQSPIHQSQVKIQLESPNNKQVHGCVWAHAMLPSYWLITIVWEFSPALVSQSFFD